MDKLEKLDYEIELQINDAPRAYNNAPIGEILNFSAEGTDVALEILDSAKTKNRTWKNDKEIIEAINTLIVERLGSERERAVAML